VYLKPIYRRYEAFPHSIQKLHLLA